MLINVFILPEKVINVGKFVLREFRVLPHSNIVALHNILYSRLSCGQVSLALCQSLFFYSYSLGFCLVSDQVVFYKGFRSIFFP